MKVKARLLLQEVARGGFGGLFLQREVHALVAAVLLRMSGLDTLDPDSEVQQRAPLVLKEIQLLSAALTNCEPRGSWFQILPGAPDM